MQGQTLALYNATEADSTIDALWWEEIEEIGHQKWVSAQEAYEKEKRERELKAWLRHQDRVIERWWKDNVRHYNC